jgi:hypothetical protein
MSSVIATPPAPVGINTGNAANAIVLLDANPALANVDIGSLIQGTVIGRDPRGQTIVETDFGQLTLATRASLPVGSDVVLQVQTAGMRLTAIVLSIDDQTIGGSARLPTSPLSSAAALGPAASQGAAASALAGEMVLPAAEIALSTGTIVTAIILRTPLAPLGVGTAAAISAAPATPNGAQLPEGSQLTVRIMEIRPPEALAMPAPAAVAAPQVAKTPQSSLQSGPPAAPAADGTATPKQIIATVLGPGTRGQVELRTPIGTIELPLPNEPPAGSTIILEQVGQPKVPLPSALGAATPAEAAANLSDNWPALRQAVAVLENSPAPSAMLEMLALPRSGPQLALGLVAFAAALEDKNALAGLGAAAIRQLSVLGQGDLVSQLRADFEHLSALADGKGTADWRSFFIPAIAERTLSQIRLFLWRPEPRRRGPKGSVSPIATGQRFVVELELSRLGALQIDGFLKERSLNLILRSHRALAQPLREALANIFGDAAAAAGLTGALGFQDVAAPFPIVPLEAVRAKAPAIVI